MSLNFNKLWKLLVVSTDMPAAFYNFFSILFPILELVDLNIQKQTLFKKELKHLLKHLLYSPDIDNAKVTHHTVDS